MCDNCNNIDPCNQCNEPEFCGCTTNLDLLCSYYNGDTLEPLGITKGMKGSEVISKINDYVKNILQNLEISPTVIENVGDGVKVHKGLSSSFIDEFKTLVGIEGIDITPEEDTVTFQVNQTWLESTIIQTIQDNGGSAVLELQFSSVETPGTPETNPENWTTLSETGSIWMAIKNKNDLEPGIWNVVKTKGDQGIQGIPGIQGQPGADGASITGATGQSTVSVSVFQRSATQPATPTGGTFLSPIPSGWSEGIPAANGNAAWMSTRILTSDGLAPQQSTWSIPSLVADTATIDYEFSAFAGTNPGTPSSPLNGAEWHNVGTENDVWMAFRAESNGVYGTWSVVRVKGEQGDPGSSGSGFSIISSNPVQSVSTGSDGTTSSLLEYQVSITAYNNSTQLFPTNNLTLADDEFRIEVPVNPHPGVTVTKENSSTLKYSIASGTTLPDTSITSLFNVVVGSSNTVLKSSFAIIPVKTAEDATSLSLNVDSNVVKYDAFGNLVTPATITATAVQQNYNETITWSSVPVGIVSGTGTTKTLNTTDLLPGSNTSVKIKITTPNGLSDETTILRVVDGAPGTPGSQGAPGINGTSGPTPRLLELVNGGQYENGQDFIDYAYYRSNDANEGWYTVNVVGGVRTVVTYTGGVPSLATWTKAPFQKEMSFGTVVAEQANLAGFIFRNQILNSQATTTTASCHPTPGVQLPNLSLDGLQGIIKFVDRMVMDKNGIALKDDCGNARIVFRLDNSGVPVLKFLDEAGVTIWEAGKEGYQVVYTNTIPESYTPIVAIYRSTAPTGSLSEFNAVFGDRTCQVNNQQTETGNTIYYDQPGPAPSELVGYQYSKGVSPTYTALQNSTNGKIFATQSNEGAFVADGYYMKNFYATIEGGIDVVKASWTHIVSGVEVEPFEVTYEVNMSIPMCTETQQTQWQAGF